MEKIEAYLVFTTEESKSYFWAGMALSIVLHIGLLYILAHSFYLPKTDFQQVINVDLESLFSKHPEQHALANQLVSMPKNLTSTEEPKETNLYSDKELYTDTQKIKRGDLDAGIPGLPLSSQVPQQPQSKIQEQQKATAAPKATKSSTSPSNTKPETPTGSKLMVRKLDNEYLVEKFTTKEAKKQAKQDPLMGYQAFSRPQGTGAAFYGVEGTQDFLPNLPDGDITLLNTKANQFAVFVRRVATQVFGQLRITGWEQLLASDIQKISNASNGSVVRAILSTSGELLNVILEEPSGSPRFDQALIEAAKRGAKDPNPPKAAIAPDGNIHFIFQAKSWVRYQPSPQTGSLSERRWLLLSTGLE